MHLSFDFLYIFSASVLARIVRDLVLEALLATTPAQRWPRNGLTDAWNRVGQIGYFIGLYVFMFLISFSSSLGYWILTHGHLCASYLQLFIFIQFVYSWLSGVSKYRLETLEITCLGWRSGYTKAQVFGKNIFKYKLFVSGLNLAGSQYWRPTLTDGRSKRNRWSEAVR